MATAKKTAPAKGGTALVPWEKEMAEAAAKGAKAEKTVGGSASISISGGILKVDDVPVPGNSMDVVVLCATHENQYYDTPFNPQQPTSPACFSFAEPDDEDAEENMKPHPDAENPQGDEDGKCLGCELNQMGTADVGRGKACKNIRRMLLVTEDALESPEQLKAAETRMLKVPVMSVKGWAAYVKQELPEMNRPYWGVVTTVAPVPDAKSQFRITFTFKELVTFDQPLYDAMKAKIKASLPSLMAPYTPMEAAPPAPPPRNTRPQGRAVGVPVRGAAPAAKKAPAGKAAAPAAKKSKY